MFDTPLFHRVAGPQTHGLVSLAVAHDGARAILIHHDASKDEGAGELAHPAFERERSHAG